MRNTTDVLTDFSSQLRDCENNYVRRANGIAKSNSPTAKADAEATQRYGQAEMVAISRRRAEAVASLWLPFKAVWGGASRASRNGSRLSGRGGEKEVLAVELASRYESRITKVKLYWRDQNGRGDVVERKDLDLN